MARNKDERCGTCAHALELTAEDEYALDRALKARGVADHDRLSRTMRDNLRVCSRKVGDAARAQDGYLFGDYECCELYEEKEG